MHRAQLLLGSSLLLLAACGGVAPRIEPGYYLTIDSANVPEVAPGRIPRHWDPTEPNCEPDPYIVVLADDWECTTSADESTLEPAWDHDCGLLTNALPIGLTWVAIDADPDADEIIAQGEVDVVETGELVLENEGVELLLIVEEIEP